MNNQVTFEKKSYSEFKTLSEFEKANYLLNLIESHGYKESSYLWFNGSTGQALALINGDVSATYNSAVKELAAQEGVTTDAIKSDYDNWYYIVPMDEVLDSIKHDLEYYS